MMENAENSAVIQLAQDVLSAYRTAESAGVVPGPICVEMAGSPKAGKTTLIDILHHFFRRINFKVWAPTEGASKRTPHHLKADWVAFNTWSLNYAVSELLMAAESDDPTHIVIMDRGPVDVIAWMRILRERGELTDNEYQIIREYALHPRWARLLTRINVFTCDSDVSLKRELKNKLTNRAGRAMNDSVLKQIKQHYEAIVAELSTEGYPVRLTDTTTENATPMDIGRELATDLLQLMDEKLRAIT